MEQLKKCPFCGSNILVTKGLGVVNVQYFFFKCQNHKCGAVVSFDNITANTYPETAVLNWNSRKDGEHDATD
mgnify:CR=1 FL=1